jgi:hypothetical protein
MLYYASYCSILQDFITMHKTARQKYLVDLLVKMGKSASANWLKSCRFLQTPCVAIWPILKSRGWRRRTTAAQSRSIFPR